MQFAFRAQNGNNELGTEGKFSWGKFGRRSGDGGAFGNDEQVHRNGQRSAAEVGQPLNSWRIAPAVGSEIVVGHRLAPIQAFEMLGGLDS